MKLICTGLMAGAGLLLAAPALSQAASPGAQELRPPAPANAQQASPPGATATHHGAAADAARLQPQGGAMKPRPADSLETPEGQKTADETKQAPETPRNR